MESPAPFDSTPRAAAPKPFADAPPAARIDAWRAKWWDPGPPGLARLVDDLPIFHGSDAAVRDWTESLIALCGSIEAHINDRCRGRVPRWMRLPKVLFGVQSVTLVRSEAKDSSTFFSATELADSIKTPLAPADHDLLREWLAAHRDGRLVMHRPFTDLAAFVYTAFEPRPRRVRFYEGGLVLAKAVGCERLVLDDHRGVLRKPRSNRYQHPLLVLGTTRIYGIDAAPAKDPLSAS
ncbi:hypothetical protein [Derxia lacustris]|uniref:hypothetical protein n=1 Tax=Derxia lacustris TaxID=764842 RepID=UPI00111C534A|nr:hypothetical protein [Derxia lacustris]